MVSTQKRRRTELRLRFCRTPPEVNLTVFPEPRLQTNDAGDMDSFLYSEQKTAEPEAAVHGSERDGSHSDYRRR